MLPELDLEPSLQEGITEERSVEQQGMGNDIGWNVNRPSEEVS